MSVLRFLGLIDENDQLSRTNLAVYLALASMVVSIVRNQTIDWASTSAFMIALVSYQAKRLILSNAAQADATRTDAEAVAKLQSTQAEHRVNLDALVSAQSLTAAAVKNLTSRLVAAKQIPGGAL